MAEVQVKQEKTVKRIVKVLACTYFKQDHDPLTGQVVRKVLDAPRGAEIEVPETEAKRLDDLGAVMKEGQTAQDAFAHQEALLDAYRGQRGDTEAQNRALARARSEAPQLNDGGLIRVDAPLSSPNELSAFLREEKLSAEDTIGLADGDPERAKTVLEAENLATGQKPRAQVKAGLQKIIDGGK